MPPTLDDLARRRLIVVSGKGGVGKSTIAAALATLAGGWGGRTLALEIDPRESLHQLFGCEPSGGALAAISPELSLQNLKPRQVVDEIVRERVRFAFLAERVFRSPVYQQFASGMPGLAELATLEHARRMTAAGGSFRRVVLDAPATGHGVSLLAAPALIAGAIRQGPVAEAAEGLAALVDDPEATAVVVVTAAEEMAVEECLELAATLERERRRGPDLVVVNALYPPYQPGATGPGVEASLLLWRERRRINERELARLRAAVRGRLLELPLLPCERGKRLLEELAGRMA